MGLRANNLMQEVADHGGSLARAQALFPDAPQPWLDLSTGINPHPYPLAPLPTSAFARLPEPTQLRGLMEIAAEAYGAPESAVMVAAPGTQILLPFIAALVPQGAAAVLSPTYAEHRRTAALVGHRVNEVADLAALYDADLAILVNPNNPDGRIVRRADLLNLAAHLRGKGGLLVVDEAFMDVGPREESLAADIAEGGIVVLRSFGKFFGLAGIRLGFAIAASPVAAALRAKLGPWAVSGPALEYGRRALSDLSWQAEMRQRLAREAAELDALLAENGLGVTGGTALFRFLRTPEAGDVFRALGSQGILARSFDNDAAALRLGLPGGGDEFDRLARALHRWRQAAL